MKVIMSILAIALMLGGVGQVWAKEKGDPPPGHELEKGLGHERHEGVGKGHAKFDPSPS